MPQARTTSLDLDADGIPRSWGFTWEGDDASVVAQVSVRPLPLVRGWGGPSAPTSRAAYVIFPLVLDASVSLGRRGSARALTGAGLAEYFDADAWRP
jgi:hypothetical protein